MTNVDVIQAEIIRNQLVSATEEMAKTLVRTAYSPLLYEIQDFGASIMSAAGEMWAETPGVIVFSQSVPYAVRAGIAQWHGNFAEGDVLIVNDPFETGTHISDTSLYMPVFWEGSLIAFCGMAAHWADIGGKSAGGWCPDTTDMFQEGLCFRHQKIIAAGAPNQALWDMIRDNVRLPVTVRGDLEAQIAACRKGVDRVRASCMKYGSAAVIAAMDHVIASTHEAMQAAISALPDGEYAASIGLDEDGIERDRDFCVCVKVTIRGDRIRLSTEGSSPVARGPINLPEPGTRCVLAASLKGLLMPFDATNEGHTLCLEIDTPGPSLVSPPRPAPSDSYGYLVVCLMELMFRCFARIAPERSPAGGFQLTQVFISRTQAEPGTSFVMVDGVHGGNGALFDNDGDTNQLVGAGDLPNSPVEILESRFPIRVDRLEYAPEVCGAGRFRGGLGVCKDYRILEEGCFASVVLENIEDPTGTGVDGGATASPGRIILNPGTAAERIFDRRYANIGPLPVGTVVRIITGGGGGWGSPLGRDPHHVLTDVRNGFLDSAAAARLYGVAVVQESSGWTLDEARTAQLRSGRQSVTQR